ncbi:MAG TPA: glycoside hydrolase family 18 protein [Vicinamibacteria bacterium]|nr:glycoside hydrolase family 18 protein [Vicinamibacteria bacterium]
MSVASAALAAALAAAPAAVPEPGRVIIGYVFVQDRLLDPSEIAGEKLTHVNYAFADIRDGKVVEGFARDAENFRALAALRAKHPHLRILVSVGGWTWSGGFSDMAATPEGRRRFVESAVDFVRRHDLDGFDVDWEYPGLPGAGNPHRPEDKENFTALMSELRSALDRDGAARKRTLLLTLAAGASPDFLAHTEMDKVAAVSDFVNLMTYDFRVASAQGLAGHHANLYPHPADPRQRSADGAVREFLAAGVPARKLVLGVPFYGRAWVVAGEGSEFLYRPGQAPAARLETKYGALSTTLVDRDGFARRWDAAAQAPYLWNADKRVFVSYEDPESLRLKARYIADKGLAGAMFWEYGADPTGALLETLYALLRRPGAAAR